MKPFFMILAATMTLAATPSIAADATNGSYLYRAYCAQCHGLEGDGFGVNTLHMPVQPRDHTEAKEMRARSDDDLFVVIKNGGPALNKSVLMPNWDANLTDPEILDLIAYLRTLTEEE